jgi:hypothetical protein
MMEVLKMLLATLASGSLSGADVIPWGAPIPCFGDPSRSVVATLGLNPSNREFVDAAGIELDGKHRRFHTLNSLRLNRWSEVTRSHEMLIEQSCREYFSRNPYDAWFGQLDFILDGAAATYYEKFGARACHLDLVPYATKNKWAHLDIEQRGALLKAGGDVLTQLLRETPISVLVLNGASVIDNFEQMAGVKLSKQVKKDWALNRKDKPGVQGCAYSGAIGSIGGNALGKEVLVLGFNHNIQSSFGVSSKVRESIRSWIGQQSVGWLK